MIVWLASYPRSGNTFFRILLHRLYGFPNYSIYNRDLTPKELESLPTADMVGETLWPGSWEMMAESREVFFVKTHEMPPDQVHPAIYIVRDGRDALVSYAHFIISQDSAGRNHSSSPVKSMGQSEAAPHLGVHDETRRDRFVQILGDLIRYNASFGGWGPNGLAWSKRECPTVIVKFEDLILRPLEIVGKTLCILEVEPLGEMVAQVPTFEVLHRELPSFFRSGQTGAWRTEMPIDIENLFWQGNEPVMRLFGYARY